MPNIITTYGNETPALDPFSKLTANMVASRFMIITIIYGSFNYLHKARFSSA